MHFGNCLLLRRIEIFCFFLNFLKVSFALAFCSLIEILLNLFVEIPKHDPSRRRLKSAWNINFIQRTISIIEDGFYQSPNHIYNQCKNLSYAIAILITGCLTLGMIELGLCNSIKLSFLN